VMVERMFWKLLLLVICLTCCYAEQTGVKRLTIPSKNTHPTCKKNEILHSDIIENHSLKRGLTPSNYTLLGKVPNMGDCMALCCSTKHCNMAYMKNNTCYGVTCYDADKCAVKNETASHEKGTQLALLIRNEMNRRVYVTAYLVVVVCAFGAAMSGTIWAVFVFYKRYSLPIITKPSNQSDDEEKCQLLSEQENEKQLLKDDQNEFQGPMLPRMHQ